MLVLNRKSGETIMLDDDISITVLSSGGKNVKLGIDAPKAVKVFRKEIYDRIQAERNGNV